MKYIYVFLFSFGTLFTFAQYDDIIYDNVTYVDYLKTVQFSHRGLTLSLPIINLGSMGALTLQFDDMDGGYKNYTYQVIHCDKDWNRSDLHEIEYIDGFNGEEIDDFAYSTNAYTEYTHYELVIPNDDLNWTISGNYLLIIYDQDMEVSVLTRRFIVTESSAKVSGLIIKPDNLSKLRTHHEIKANIEYGGLNIRRPKEELFLTVMQNGNTNSAYVNLQGTFVRQNTLFYDNFDEITFPAIKEFRNCDVRSLKFRSEFVHSIDQKDGVTNVLLDLGKKRADKHFHTEPDANGGFIIDNRDYDGGTVNSEYVRCIFTLEAEREYDEDVYIVGAFSDWKANDKFKMEYDPTTGIYEKVIVLKQGFYDFMFATLNNNGLLEMDVIEGSWYETENDYQLIAYYRATGGEYDRVIDVAVINSNPSN